MIGTLLRGIVLGLSITAPIGPTNVEVLRRGTREGWRTAATFCLGVMVALMLYLLLVVFGLSLLTRSSVFNTLMTGLGVVVLAYLAYSSFRDFFGGVQVDLSTGDVQSTRHFVPGIVLTLSNPAVLVLWMGIMGADLATSSATVGEGLLLSLGILIGVATFFTALTVLIHFARQWLRPEHFKYVSLVAGIVLLYFCLRFAYELLASFP